MAPSSSMTSISAADYGRFTQTALAQKYRNAVDRESAHEIVQRKLAAAQSAAAETSTPAPRVTQTSGPSHKVDRGAGHSADGESGHADARATGLAGDSSAF